MPNSSIEAQIAPDERYFLTTLEHCDCGTPLGALTRGDARATDWPAQEQRLRKKGWGQSKVVRALAQMQERERVSSQAKADALLESVAAWVEFITAVLGSGKTTHLGLLLHQYSGSLEDSVPLAGHERVRSANLTGETLCRLKEDVLYDFRQ